MYLKSILIFALCLGYGNVAQADVQIPVNCRWQNEKPGWCLWLSVATVLEYWGYNDVDKMVKSHLHEKDGAWPADAEEQLDKLVIGYTSSRAHDLDFIRKWLAKDRPVVVTCKQTSILGAHTIVVYKVTDTHVYFVDTNIPRSDFRFEIKYFVDDIWDNWALVIDPKK